MIEPFQKALRIVPRKSAENRHPGDTQNRFPEVDGNGTPVPSIAMLMIVMADTGVTPAIGVPSLWPVAGIGRHRHHLGR